MVNALDQGSSLRLHGNVLGHSNERASGQRDMATHGNMTQITHGCREENNWCREENNWCREENNWCREENNWCREEKLYFGATVTMVLLWSTAVMVQLWLVRDRGRDRNGRRGGGGGRGGEGGGGVGIGGGSGGGIGSWVVLGLGSVLPKQHSKILAQLGPNWGPTWPNWGPTGVQLGSNWGPTGVQQGPIWNAAWVVVGIQLGNGIRLEVRIKVGLGVGIRFIGRGIYIHVNTYICKYI